MNRISIIGSGHVATHLAHAFRSRGAHIVQISSRTLAHAQALATTVGAQATDNVDDLLPADLYIIAVTDSAIREVASRLHPADAPVVHTAGSAPLSTLDACPRAGVLYPMQTFSRSRLTIDWNSIPLFIEARDDATLALLKTYAQQLSPDVREADSAQRLQLHTAAVFACNYVNYLLTIAADLSGAHFPTFHPLVCETIEKAFAAPHPRDVQTGPAARNDRDTIATQLAALPPQYQTLYADLSARINHHTLLPSPTENNTPCTITKKNYTPSKPLPSTSTAY
ncbi:MAG: DUF2520 domain-containing protein [Prevotellaceae bacterium]|jgi:predicted short-subunit dehydrogenase-like oxidoreductase (DUF2520 family)|nr:DUF2520 domain-containing protein [Prevotellaceae bacterium]